MATESAATTAAGALAAPPDRQLLRARLFLRAALPVAKVILDDDPGMKKRFERVRARVQFVAKGAPEPVGAYLLVGPGGLPGRAGVL